jgi:4-amino-4-deoxy-L-arabinose transferase-like glycosyltransferase
VNHASAPSTRERWLYIGLAALVGCMWLANLGLRPLFNPDEGRYAEIPREMLAGGDWVIPHLNGLAYAEKPPLQYWATALSYRVFGINEFAARLYCALCALGTIALVWLMARREGGSRCAWLAAAVLSGMLIFAVLGQLLTLDMSLTFYLTLSLTGFLFAQPAAGDATSRAGSGRWMLAAWAAAALGVMTKGIIAAVIPAAVLILHSLWTRDFTAWHRLRLSWGLPLFLIVTVPWHWLAARRDGDFLQFYFVHEHVARYLTPIAQRVEPWWFFLAVFVGGSAPWTLSALRVVAVGWRRTPGGGFDARLFLWIWVVFVVVFFSLSDSKLMPYILPIMPVLALRIALLPPEVFRRDCLVTAIFTLVVGAALGWASLHWPQMLSSSDRAEYFLPLAKPAAKIAALLCVSGIFVLVQGARHPTRAAVFLGVGWCLAWVWLGVEAAAVAPVYSGLNLAQAIPASERGAPIYSVATYDQTLEFYLQRSVTLVRFRGELEYGLNKNPGADIPDLQEFERRWSADSQAFAVMGSSMFEKLHSDGLPMRVIGRTADRLVAARQ